MWLVIWKQRGNFTCGWLHYWPWFLLTPPGIYSLALWFCSYSHKWAKFSFVTPCLWFPPYDLLWLEEWTRNVSMPVLGVSLKKSYRFPPAFPSSATVMRRTSPGCCCPFSLGPKINTHEAEPPSWHTDLKLPSQPADCYFKPLNVGIICYAVLKWQQLTNTVANTPTVFWRGSIN